MASVGWLPMQSINVEQCTLNVASYWMSVDFVPESCQHRRQENYVVLGTRTHSEASGPTYRMLLMILTLCKRSTNLPGPMDPLPLRSPDPDNASLLDLELILNKACWRSFPSPLACHFPFSKPVISVGSLVLRSALVMMTLRVLLFDCATCRQDARGPLDASKP